MLLNYPREQFHMHDLAEPPVAVSEEPPGAKIVLVNTYELGRQPFALAEPAAWLRSDGFEVHCLDLSLDKLEPDLLAGVDLIAIHVGMYTATRIAVKAIPQIQALAPRAHLCVYGLYAPMNEKVLRDLGVDTVLGGEFEPGLLSRAERLRDGRSVQIQTEPVIHLGKIPFIAPDRSGLPVLSRYTHLEMPDGTEKVVGFVEASRGCKHLCRHCPVVPVYQGKFRIVPVDVVMADIYQQVVAGAEHISFGDPDFLNGPTHALRVVRALHEEFSDVTFDATIKIEHIVKHADLLPELKGTGCLFITSAVESVDDKILEYLDKRHTSRDFARAVELLRTAGIALAPTFVPFTPWTTLQGYVDLLQRIVDLKLVESVPPIQLSIRLLVPEGSYLQRLPGFRSLIQDFDPKILGYPWQHAEPRVDRLQEAVQSFVGKADGLGLSRCEIFERIWQMAHDAMNRVTPPLPDGELGSPIPHLSEPWYCCAEPTEIQLQSF